jgi:hypothetical protein
MASKAALRSIKLPSGAVQWRPGMPSRPVLRKSLMKQSDSNKPPWKYVADALEPVPDDQKVAMLATFEAKAKRMSDLEMLRAVKDYRRHQEEIRQKLIERAKSQP